jgi:hypothetical protein
MPDSPPKTAVEMKKTQPLVTMPKAIPQPAPVVTMAPPESEPIVEEMSMGLCWGLLAVAAVTLLIQIWNYFS